MADGGVGGRRCHRQGQRGAVKARALFEGEPPNSRDGAVQRGPICGRQRRLDRLTGERVDEAIVAIVTDVADTVDQSVSDRLVNDWKALRDRFIEGPSHEWQREVPGRRSRAVPAPRRGRCEAAGPDARCRPPSPERPPGRTTGYRR